MKAIVQYKRGKNFSTMQVEEISSSTVKSGEVKIKVAASRINPADNDLLKGFPSLKYKKPQIGGVDGSGEIIELGSPNSNFKVGDQVFFYRKFSDMGTWAEEICIPEKDIALIPQHLSLKEAGSIALPLLTAYEALKSLKPKAGKSILIHGAGGGVGFMAVQLAKHFQLIVIAHASSRSKELLNEVGVEAMIDYKTEDFASLLDSDPPDYIFDVVGKSTLLKSIQLKAEKVVSIAFPDTSQMHKAGIQLPGIFRFLMKMMGAKFSKAAKRNKVELIGQVTGPNGKLMQEASEAAVAINLTVPTVREISINEIEERGLTEKDLGKTIVF